MADAAKGRERLEAARRSKLAQQAPLVCDDEPQRNYTQVHNNVSRCALLSDGAFRTYFNIKSHYWGRGSCFPGLDLLASYQGVSERTIRSNIAELKTAGLLDVYQRGLGLTNEYVIPSAQHWTPEALEAARARRRQQQTGNVLPLRENANGPEVRFRSGPEVDFRSRPEVDFRLRRHSIKKTQKEEDTGSCAASATQACDEAKDASPMDAEATVDDQPAHPEPNQHAPAHARSRARKMTDEEKTAVEAALARFNEKLRPIVDDEYGRFMREALHGIRGFGAEHFLATIDLMATNPRYVDDPHVTPLLVTKTVPIWEDNGKPRSWRALQECKKRRMQNGRH